jgi:hypothetical protein
MKKVVLETVDLVKLNNFIDSLISLNGSGTIYFKLGKNGISTDSHNESGTIVKSIRNGLNDICGSSNIDKLDKPIKLCFYDGKKVKKAFSFLSGNEIKCEIEFAELEDEYFAKSMKVSSPKISITLDAADPELFEFANVPEEGIAAVKDTSAADCKFRMTSNEVLQVQKFFDFDTNEEIEFKVNGAVRVCSKDSYDIDISDDFEGIDGDARSYVISKELFTLLDVNSYWVYPIYDETKIIFEAEDNSMEVVITLFEDVEL